MWINNEVKELLFIDVSDIVTIGITNQRETTVVWDKTTGKPLHNAIGMYFLIFVTTRMFFFFSFTPLENDSFPLICKP